jgi:PhnB protein
MEHPSMPKSIPEGFHSVTPMLALSDAAAAIEFYKKAFGATELYRLTEPSGKIGHAEIKIGDSIIMLADEYPGHNIPPDKLGGSSVVLNVFVENVDELFNRAVENGAKVMFPLKDQFYGDRSGRVQDPFGHLWILSKHIEDVSPAEMQKRFQAMFT